MLESLFLTAALTLGQPPFYPPPDGPTMVEPPYAQEIIPAAAAGDTLPPAAGPAQPIQITAPLMPPPAAPAAAAAAAPAAAPPPRWFLMKELQGTWEGGVLDANRIQVYGWLQGSFTASTADDFNLPMEFNYRANQFLLQQAWARVAQSVVTTGTTEPTFGFESDWIFGTDYRFTLARGVFNNQLTQNNGIPNEYGVDPVQFYGEAYIPTIAHGLDLKLGRFYTPFGVESIEAVSTPFLSHTYTFANAPPFTHTGILGTLTIDPEWTVQAGLVAGNDVLLFNNADTPTGLFTLQWTQPGGGRNVVKFAAVVNKARFDVGANFQNYDVFDVVWTHLFNPVLTYNMETIYGLESNFPDQTDENGNPVHIGQANWAGWANYIAYTMSPRLVAQARFELFDDPQGVRTLGVTGNGVGQGPQFVTESKGLYNEITLGLVFTPRINKSIIIRPEVRWDHNDESPAFDGHHNLLTASTDLILRW